MKVQLGVSNHHFHLTEADYKVLFGDTIVENIKELVQKGQYASNIVATIKTEKGSIDKVRLLMPFRNYTQVEISKTDAYKLGINPPIRDSGNITGASEVEIIGTHGSIKKECAIIATRHIHMTKDDQEKLGLIGKSEVSVKFDGIKSGTFEHVYLKVDPTYTLELHLDTDDANAFLLTTGDVGEIK